MPTQQQVLQLVDQGLDYEQIAQRLDVAPGLAYLIATGVAADGSDSLTTAERKRPGFLPVSQQLSNPPHEKPTSNERVLQWVRQRAQTDAQMQAAAAARTPGTAAPSSQDADDDVISQIGRDHNHVNGLTKQLTAIPGHKKGGTPEQLARRARLVQLIAAAVPKHDAAEQQFLWPTVRRRLPDGEDLLTQGRQQEEEGAATLTRLTELAPDTEEFDELVEQLVAQLRKHVAFEDKVLLALASATSSSERTKLGRRFKVAEAQQ